MTDVNVSLTGAAASGTAGGFGVGLSAYLYPARAYAAAGAFSGAVSENRPPLGAAVATGAVGRFRVLLEPTPSVLPGNPTQLHSVLCAGIETLVGL